MKDIRLQVVLAGDILVLALVTLVGFATHGELGVAGSRMLTTFIPLVTAWLLVAPHLGAFELQRLSDPRQLWRPFWAMVLGAPFAGLLRGVMLNSPVIPIFVVILGGISALSLLAWRSVYWLIIARRG